MQLDPSPIEAETQTASSSLASSWDCVSSTPALLEQPIEIKAAPAIAAAASERPHE
jgi:hypothetical protein